MVTYEDLGYLSFVNTTNIWVEKVAVFLFFLLLFSRVTVLYEKGVCLVLLSLRRSHFVND